MQFTKRAAALAAAGAIGLAGVGAAVVAPIASAATESSESATAEDRTAARTTAIREALDALVEDGSITAEQADEVAGTLATSDSLRGRGGPGGHGGPGRGLIDRDAAAEALGVTEDELHTALHDGRTLAQVAEAEGVELQTLVDALVAAGSERIDQAVTDGRLTEAQADELRANLPERVQEAVETARPGRGDGFGRGGRDGGDDSDRSTESRSPSPSATTSGA